MRRIAQLYPCRLSPSPGSSPGILPDLCGFSLHSFRSSRQQMVLLIPISFCVIAATTAVFSTPEVTASRALL